MPLLCSEPYPTPSEYDPLFNAYPYPLSDFQKYAIEAIITGQHVLSCAHTGSGKTLAAEFAIQHFVQQGKKVIYTSPIKALSNQKYYEFTKKYPDITFGLMTGDIKTNPCAQVLIMTTEILMNRLFIANTNHDSSVGTKGTDGLNGTKNTLSLDFDLDLETELACVVFDEVHYINDQDRGHVWEQTIMMLPNHVQMVMLSATIDNPLGFAEWCENCQQRPPIHNENQPQNPQNPQNPQKKVYLASTEKRVVPLTHYMYFATTEEPFKKLKDKEQQRIIRECTNQLLPILTPLEKKGNTFHDAAYHKIGQMHKLYNKERFFMKRKFVLNHLAEHLRDNEMLPAIVFVFSRKHVEQCAHEITANILEFDSKVAYTMRRDCEQIVRKFPNAQEYLELPEFNVLVALLEKGIGIHHSGMIPVLREIVEIMISRKCVKMLFATESFAIGLDCPIRTAVFTSLQKYTSEGLRHLHAHEYTQMAGRAGRRGIDTVGHVIHLNNLFREQPPIETYRTILGGKPQQLVSKFHVTYAMILHLVKNGQNTTQQMAAYANSTMWAKEIEHRIEAMEKGVQEKGEAITFSEHSIEDTKDSVGFVPATVCRKYNEYMANMQLYPQKKRKEIEKEMASWKEEYRFLLAYCEKYKNLDEKMKDWKQDVDYLTQLRTTVEVQVKAICDVLAEDLGMLKPVTEDGYALTEGGQIAANVAEIHPLLAAKLIQESQGCDKWTATDFVVFFSCFTQIKLDEENRRLGIPDTVSAKMRGWMRMVSDEMYGLEKREQERGMYTGICYEDMMTYDLVEEMEEWTRCETEQQCKYFIQVVLANRGIGIGDFSKAVLKIATIAREWQGLFEMLGNLPTAQCLSEVEGLILKYITTCQSLYV